MFILCAADLSGGSLGGCTVDTDRRSRAADMDLVCKPRSKSIVWLYFGLKADDKGQPLNSGEAICRLCRKIVLAKGGNTTNLRSHLQRRHRADFLETTSSTTSGALSDTQGDMQLTSMSIIVITL